ncbi:MAG: hypothetical protein AB7C90_03570, partial [Bacteroidales bacterium]
MMNGVRIFVLGCLVSLFFAGCEKSSGPEAPDYDKMGAAEDLLRLTPELQPETFRNIDKLFPTRTIKRGRSVFPLPYQES